MVKWNQMLLTLEYLLLYYFLFGVVVKKYIPIDMQKHKMTTFFNFFTNNKKGQYKLYNIDAVKTNQLKIT